MEQWKLAEWHEITVDNVDDLYNKKNDGYPIIFGYFDNMWEHPIYCDELGLGLSMHTMAKRGGFFAYVCHKCIFQK